MGLQRPPEMNGPLLLTLDADRDEAESAPDA